MPPVWARVPRDVGSSKLRRALLMWQGGSFFCSALSGPNQPYLKTEFSRAGCILMLMLRDLLDMSAKTRFFFFFFRHFSSLQFCHSLLCPKRCDGWHLFDPLCVSGVVSVPCRGKWDRRGLGKNKQRGLRAKDPDNLVKSHVIWYHWRARPVQFGF